MKTLFKLSLFLPFTILLLTFFTTSSFAQQQTDICEFRGPPVSAPGTVDTTIRRIWITLRNNDADDIKVNVKATSVADSSVNFGEDITLAGTNTAFSSTANFYLRLPTRAPAGDYTVEVKESDLSNALNQPIFCKNTGATTVKIAEIPGIRRDITSTLKNVENPAPFGSVGDILTALIPNIFAIAGMLAFVFLVFGGIRYALARGDAKATDSARGVITNAITGLIIILVVFVIFEIITAVFKISIFSLIPAVRAQETIDIGSKLKLGNDPIAGIFPNIASLVTAIIAAATALMGVIFFALLIWGGIRYMLARGDEKATQAARGVLTNAVIGLLIVLGAFAIITLIGLFTGQSGLLP